MKYLSVCSGIEAASVAWEPLGWEPVAFSEVEAFPNAVLEHRYPNVPNLGDMEKIDGTRYRGAVDVLVGGTPCQAFSIAGGRAGLRDPRGGLAMHFCRLVDEVRPGWVIWENVPGVLSSNKGRDFASFLGALQQLGYDAAWRVLDAQNFRLAQRRKRVFVVACPRGGGDPGAVLLEPASLCGDSPPSRETGEATAPGPEESPGSGSGGGLTPTTMKIRGGKPGGGKGVLCSEDQSFTLSTRQDQTLFCPEVALTLQAKDSQWNNPEHETYVPEAMAFEPGSVARNAGPSGEEPTCSTLRAQMGDNQPAVRQGMVVRRLTPTECERLMGFPDGWTLVPWYRGRYTPETPEVGCPDGHRYKALGNSMAVPVMRWIGERIQ
jgi:DNA (cytosine-5)-methyltransferase 1